MGTHFDGVTNAARREVVRFFASFRSKETALATFIDQRALRHHADKLHDHGATDVSDTLHAALQASGLDQVKVLHRPRLLSK
jgi:hypothetical protein